MAFDKSLADRVRSVLAGRKNVEEKRMFGGLAFLLGGNLLVGVWKDSLLVRLAPDESDEALQEPLVSPFHVKGRGAIRGWVLVDALAVENDEPLKGWVQRAVAFVGLLAAKPRKR